MLSMEWLEVLREKEMENLKHNIWKKQEEVKDLVINKLHLPYIASLPMSCIVYYLLLAAPYFFSHHKTTGDTFQN